MRYCVNCGAMNDTDARFCSGCGKKFDSAPAEETVTDDGVKHENADYRSFDNYTGSDSGESFETSKADNMSGAAFGVGHDHNAYGNTQYDNSGFTGGYDYQNNKQGYSYQPESADGSKGMSIASLILGICSIALSWLLPVIPLACGIVGLVLGVKVRKKGDDNGMAKAGRITSIIGIVLGGLIIILSIIAVIGLVSVFTTYPEYFNQFYEHGMNFYNITY